MMRRGKKSKPAEVYLVRGKGPAIAFVPDPTFQGRWLRVHPCVVLNSCERCGAARGEPCIYREGATVSHHYLRAKGVKIPKVDPTGIDVKLVGCVNIPR